MYDGKQLLSLSKNLRTKQTPWESRLWYFLRGGRFYGLKFKRQVSMGKFIVDFCCNEKKLIIELDGSQHNQIDNFIDKERDYFFKLHGYKVLRFWNNDIDDNIDGVLEKIKIVISRGSTSL